MKIACICSTKNEGDIIEAFIRLNGRICDSFFFADDSSDNTRQIIGLLAKEGYDLNYLPKSEGGYNQPHPTKAYLSAVGRKLNPDWIFLLDADEMIIASSKDDLLQEMQDIPPDTYLAAEWKTYVPVKMAYFDTVSPLSDCFALRKDKGEVYKKVSIPGGIADHIMTTPGNHSARSLSRIAIHEQTATSYHLAHFPVRSAEQIIVKNVLATHNLATRTDALSGEGFHVFPVLQMIRNRDYKLTLDDVANLAINYGCSDQLPATSIPDALDPGDNSPLKAELRYLDLGRINVTARLDFEIERLSLEMRMKKRGTRLDGLYFQVHDR